MKLLIIFILCTFSTKIQVIWLNPPTILAKSSNYEAVEGNLYFHPQDVEMKFLIPSKNNYTCDWKGDGTYFHLMIDNKIRKLNFAWQILNPKFSAEIIKGLIGFKREKNLIMERVNEDKDEL